MILCLGGKECTLCVGGRNVQVLIYRVCEEGMYYVVTVSG